MCGRYASAKTDTDLAQEFGVDEVVGQEPHPSWNIAPTQIRRVIIQHRSREDSPETPVARVLRSARWGLVPSWAKDLKIGHRLINARSETLTTKPAFRAAAARRRGLIPADGYFEWEKIEGRKVPHYLHKQGQRTLAFAGLYELWPDPGRDEQDPNRWIWTYTIVTRPASDTLGHIHDRSPVIVPPELWVDWLDPSLVKPDQVNQLLAAIPDPQLQPREVSEAVNSVQNNGPQLVAPV